MVCNRCGNTENIHKHHIRHKIDGGGDEPENIKCLCRGCHIYHHKRDILLKHIATWTARLEIIDKENTIDLIKERGYHGYWTTEKLLEKLLYKESTTVHFTGEDIEIT